jgi:hypothetical protein
MCGSFERLQTPAFTLSPPVVSVIEIYQQSALEFLSMKCFKTPSICNAVMM